jgi:hypothetical protein
LQELGLDLITWNYGVFHEWTWPENGSLWNLTTYSPEELIINVGVVESTAPVYKLYQVQELMQGTGPVVVTPINTLYNGKCFTIRIGSSITKNGHVQIRLKKPWTNETISQKV